MAAAIFTLYESNYHYGVAAVINSALLAGFRGRFFVGFRDVLPPWVQALQRVNDDTFVVQDIPLTFYHEAPPRHLGFHKPFAAMTLLDRFPEIDCLFYADPDITFLCPWSFLDDWAMEGIGLVEDVSFSDVSKNHPWRREWRNLLGAADVAERDYCTTYPNSGFFCLRRHCETFLRLWANLTLTYEATGGNTQEFQMRDRTRAIVSDQDLLAATLMGCDQRVSMIGPDAMGFRGYFFALSHAVESPKPWAKSHTLHALRGTPPTQAAKRYLQFSNHPIRVESEGRSLLRKIDFSLGQLVSRFYRRS